jgi:hypothetical protein
MLQRLGSRRTAVAVGADLVAAAAVDVAGAAVVTVVTVVTVANVMSRNLTSV